MLSYFELSEPTLEARTKSEMTDFLSAKKVLTFEIDKISIIGILEIAEVILVLVLTKERVARFIFKHKIFHKEVQNENKNDGNGATNRKTSTGRNESLTETTENENQNNANG